MTTQTFIGMWVTADGHIRHELLPNGRYDEARGSKRSAYQGRYVITGIRRFLMHVLPKGFHRIRHYGLFANGNRAADIARARKLLAMPPRLTDLMTQNPPSQASRSCIPIHARVAAVA